MRITITKGARQFGYLIWNSKSDKAMEELFAGKEKVHVNFNGFDLGEKNIDRKYHRVSLGYKLTRALPQEHNEFLVEMKNDTLEVRSASGSK